MQGARTQQQISKGTDSQKHPLYLLFSQSGVVLHPPFLRRYDKGFVNTEIKEHGDDLKILYKQSKFSNAVFFLSVFTKDACKHRQKEHRIIDWFEAQLRQIVTFFMKYGKNEYCFGNNYEEIMTNELLGTLDADTFDELIESYITQSEPDMMSFEAFEQGAQRLAQQAITETIEVTGVVKDNKIVFESSEPTLVTVHDNELWIGGLRLVIKLRQPDALTATI